MTKTQMTWQQHRRKLLAERGIYPSPEVYYDEVAGQQRKDFEKMNSLEGCGKIDLDSDQYKNASHSQRQKILDHNQELLDKEKDLQQTCMSVWLAVCGFFCFIVFIGAVGGAL